MNVSLEGFKAPMPQELILFIKDLHRMCIPKNNAIVAWGFSRGAKWLQEIVREYSIYLDVAIIIAGYPGSKDQFENASEAKALIAANKTLVCMVHFAADECCNAHKYPRWCQAPTMTLSRYGLIGISESTANI